MIRRNAGLIGPATIAEKLLNWHQSDSPDLIDATIQYITDEWVEYREASVAAVYSVYLKFRDLGATGNSDAAILATELDRLLEQNRSP